MSLATRERGREGEKLILVLRPHWLDAVLARVGKWLFAVVAGAALWFAGGAMLSLQGGVLAIASVAPVVALAVYALSDRASRVYVLSDQRAHARGGIVTRFTVDAPLASLTHTAMRQTLAERLLGLGTIGFATAGTDGYEVVWRSVAFPERVLEQARQAIKDARAEA